MKVICIDTKDMEYFLIPGYTYTVIDEMLGTYYQLQEIPFNHGEVAGFYKWRFILVSEIDEKEFERNYNKEIA